MRWHSMSEHDKNMAWLAEVNRRKGWHKWFAWYPVRIGSYVGYSSSGNMECWLENVERRIAWEQECGGFTYEYRLSNGG